MVLYALSHWTDRTKNAEEGLEWCDDRISE